VRAGLAPSKKEARRLVEQGGVQVNGVTVTDVATMVDDGDVQGERILLKKGKKTFHRVVVK